VSPLESAVRLGDDLLFPAAMAVDRADRVPASHFEALAREGLYGAEADLRIVEALASGCLATAFVWLQHLGALASSASSHSELHAALARGRLKGGIARAGARPGTRSLRVASTVDGYRLDGQVPWVTGWGMIDIIEVAALDEHDNVVFLLVDAETDAKGADTKGADAKGTDTKGTDTHTDGANTNDNGANTNAHAHDKDKGNGNGNGNGIRSSLNHLVAVNASRTATLTFSGHRVPADRFVRSQPYRQWQAAEASGSRLNGGLALGVASRCIRLLKTDQAGLRSEVDACRQALLRADDDGLPRARAAAGELAMRAALTLTVQTGSRSVLLDDHAQRLVREATFLLVFGTREKIKAALLELIAD
jgi:hypothetical protein